MLVSKGKINIYVKGFNYNETNKKKTSALMKTLLLAYHYATFLFKC